jgi:hypothetical protein
MKTYRKKNIFSRLHIAILFLAFAISLFGPTTIVVAQNAAGDDINFVVPNQNIAIPGVSFTTDENLLKQSVTENDGQTFIQIPFLAEYLAGIYRYAIGIAGAVAVIMIVIAGFQWATSGGSPDVIGAAKERITNAVTGLLLVLCSYSLLYAINPELVQFRALSIPYIGGDTVDFFDKGPIDELVGIAGVSNGAPINWSNPGCRITPVPQPPGTTRRNRNGTVIANEGHISAIDVVRCATLLNTRVYLPQQPSVACPLENTALVGLNSDGNPQAQFSDDLLERYAACTTVDAGLLRAIAYRESELNPLAGPNYLGFTGLFQTLTEYCQSSLGSPLSGYCDDGRLLFTTSKGNHAHEGLKNAEVSTMVGTAMLRNSLQVISRKFGTSCSPAAVFYLSYLGHHNGLGAMQQIANRASSCNVVSLCQAMYAVQQQKNGGLGQAVNCSVPPDVTP